MFGFLVGTLAWYLIRSDMRQDMRQESRRASGLSGSRRRKKTVTVWEKHRRRIEREDAAMPEPVRNVMSPKRGRKGKSFKPLGCGCGVP